MAEAYYPADNEEVDSVASDEVYASEETDDEEVAGSDSDVRTYLDVNPACNVTPTADIRATINGVPTNIAPAIRSAENVPGVNVLRISRLGLNLSTAADAVLCITLKPNRLGRGCTSLEDLCPSQPSQSPKPPAPADPEDITRETPPPPLSPPPVTPFDCPVCLTVQLIPPAVNLYPYSFDMSECSQGLLRLVDGLNGLALAYGAQMTGQFRPVDCSDNAMVACGAFAFPAEAAKVPAGALEELSYTLLDDIAGGGAECHPELQGYSIQAYTSASSCLQLSVSKDCVISPLPNNCTCNTTAGVMPYKVSPRYNVTAVPARKSNLYCFTIEALPDGVSPLNAACGPVDILSKVEFFAGLRRRRVTQLQKHLNWSFRAAHMTHGYDTIRSLVRGFELIPSVGTSRTVSPTWGPKGLNTVKASQMKWNATQAIGGRVCLELRDTTSLDQICLDGSGNPTSRCLAKAPASTDRVAAADAQACVRDTSLPASHPDGAAPRSPSSLRGEELLKAAPATPIILAQSLDDKVAEIIARYRLMEDRLAAVERQIVDMVRELRAAPPGAVLAAAVAGPVTAAAAPGADGGAGSSSTSPSVAVPPGQQLHGSGGAVSSTSGQQAAADLLSGGGGSQQGKARLFEINRIQSAITEVVNSGYLESVKGLRETLLVQEWGLQAKNWARRRGVSAFEEWCAVNAPEEVSYDIISALYDDPDALHVLPTPRLRMMARAMIEQHTLQAYDEVFRRCTSTAEGLARVGLGDLLPHTAGVGQVLRGLLPGGLPFLSGGFWSRGLSPHYGVWEGTEGMWGKRGAGSRCGVLEG
ncbi:hypothetical protein VOLCADRAFT_104461 [Volvox carteri f. nagariensis]|uniref:Pherophorin domain-containing protein n=1 Tax=Volvox carteri f. nagariensis TaxID=3068 RepID=D8TTR3_VOLCA|nr:uncharacterized protein VOLCADRAFT_104461 [Volvox carteri f. nagariensis]EFJ49240.1 hypothetical protein VOLCADRAFT_104461 [Volvox carteri f. nagariensis]|eukprot:XP_002949688.1 hypothetical protein VOLCADRAFT_104461 [Volvox carteri f. nagariensis]